MKKSALKKFNLYNSSENSSRLVKIGEASALLNVSIDTLRRWEKKGWLVGIKTPGGTRLYDKDQLQKLNPHLKRGPKPLISPLLRNTSASSNGVIPSLGEGSKDSSPTVQNDNNQKLSLSTDTPVLKTISTLSTHDQWIDYSNEFGINQESILNNLKDSFHYFKFNLITLLLTAILFSLISLPVYLLSNHFKDNQTVLTASTKFQNNPISQASGLTRVLASLFSPDLSRKFFGKYEQGAPPGDLTQNLNDKANPAQKRDLGNLNGVNFPTSQSSLTGSVLAEATPGAFLQINLDTEISGTASVSGNLTAPNIVYSITPGTNISVTGDAQRPTISATGLTETDTLATVTGRGATTSVLTTFSGGVNLGNVLNLGTLTSDPSSAQDGATYYNTTTETFRCYVNGSWVNCDTSGSSSSGDITAVSTGNGLSGGGSSGDVTISLDVTTTSTTTTTSSNSGLEVSSSGLSLLRGCADTEILSWDATNVIWECGSAGGGGSMTSFNLAGDSGTTQTISDTNTVTIAGGTNGIDTAAGATDTVTLNLDTTEIGTTTFGSGSGFTWTFDAGATDPTLALASDQVTLGAATTVLSGTTTLTASSLATFTTAATLGMASTTTLNLGTAATINSAGTDLNLQADGTIDVDIAGGSGATGCTVANSTGNLTCSGNITGSSSGTVGFWTRTSTTLSPATANDIVSIATTNTTGADLAITNTGVYTGTGIFNLTANSATTGILQNISGNGLTSGNAISVNSSSTAFTGALGLFTLSGSNAANTGNVLEVANTGTANTGTSLYVKHYATGTNNLALRVDDVSGDTSPFVIDGAGNVGIGDSSPDAALDIETALARINLNTTNAGGVNWAFISATNAAHGVPDGSLLFWDGTANIMTLSSTNDRVGIGDTDPDSKLEVLSTTEQLRLTYTEDSVDSRFTVDSSGNLTIDNTGTKTVVADDFQVTGNDILDSAAATRITLGATTTLTNTTTTLSGTTTLTASSLATLTTAATLGMASTTTLNLGSNSTINSAATALNLQADGTIDVNIAGGSGATGCTVANSTGNLTCSGSITGGSSGTNGFWTRTSTTLSPATANDIVSIATTNTTGADLAITNTGVYTGTGIFNLTANSATTGNVGSISANGLTTGNALAISSTSIAGEGSGASYLLNLARSGSNSNATHTAYGIASSVTNTGTTSVNVGGLFTATGATTNRGVEVAAMTGATSTGLTIGALSGTTANTGVSVGAISGSGATGTGITVGNISTTGATNVGLVLGTMTGGTATNYQISTGTVTAIASSTSYQANLGAVVGASSATFGSINTGAISGAGTQSAGIVLGANSSTATTNYGMTIGAISGAGTTNTGLNIAAVSGATNNYAIKTAQGSVDITDNSNTVASLVLTNNTATTIGNGANTSGVIDLQSTSLTTGNFMNIEVNALTTGKGINLTNTTTLTSGTLLNVATLSTALTGTATTGSGLLGNFDWTPGSSTTATGDLLRLHIGPNGTTTGSLFNIVDDTSSIFAVSETSFTSSLPVNFTSPGDVAVAYDLTFTNPTASFITSLAPLNIRAGDSPNSSNLSLQTYNAGSVVIQSGSAAATNTNGLLNVISNSTTASNIGVGIDYTTDTGTTAAADGTAFNINLTQNDADADMFGAVITALATTNAAAGSYEALLKLVNAENTIGAVTDGILIDSTSATDTDITDAIDVSDSNITNAINVGQNFILGDGIRVFSSSSTVYTIEDTAGNDLCTITDAGTTGNLNCTGTITGSGSGAVGYWTRSSTTISPATANDIVSIPTTNTTGADLAITNTGVYTGTGIFNLTANSATTGDIGVISGTALTTGSLLTLTGPSGGTAGVTDAGLKISSDVGNIGTSNGLISSTATIDSTANAISGVNLYLSTVSSQALATTVSQDYYGIRNILAKTGADTTSGTINSYGTYSTASNTGGDTAGTRNTYGGYFSATGDSSGTTTAYGLYATASGADTNYSAAFGDGTDLITFSSVGDILFVDADGGATITGPAGGAISLIGAPTSGTGVALESGAGSSIIVNDLGLDVDFKVEGDNNTNLLVIDAGLFSGVGQVSIGSAAQGTATAFTVIDNPAITATSNQNFYKAFIDNNAAVTVSGATTSSVIASLAIDEPNITATGTVTNASTLYISGAPTEGSSGNFALWVDNGESRFENLPVSGSTTGSAVTVVPSYIVEAADLTLSGVRVALDTNSNTDAGDVAYGVNIDDITSAAGPTEYGLRIGSGYDYQAYFELGTRDLRLSVTQPSAGTSPLTLTVPAIAADDSFCIRTLSNCFGAGASGVTYTGQTTNAITKFTSNAGEITSAGLTDDGSTFAFSANRAISMAAGTGNFTQTYQPSGSTGTANAHSITSTFGIDATDQTLSGIFVDADTNSNTDSGDVLYGVNVDTITASSATEYGIGIGSGYDYNLYFNDTSTNVLLADGGTITISDGTNTLCTVTDAGTTGNLNCTGTITGSGSGAVGYWTRSSTTISPATANDIVSIPTTNTTGADLAITNTGVYTGTGIVNLTANSATTGTLFNVSGTGLTTGKGILVTGGSALTTGNLLSLASASYAHTANETGSLVSLAFTDATITTNTSTTNGLLVSPTLNVTTGASGTKTLNGISVAPTFTACTGGSTCVTNGLDLATITDTANNTSTALNIGSGWDTDINATTSLEIGIGGTNELYLDADDFSPATSDSNALGDTDNMWSDLFLASGAVINFNNGDVTLTHAADALTIAGGAVTISGSADGTDALTLTAGDILITDGDFDLSAGDFNVNLDAADTANFSGTAPTSVATNGTNAATNTLLVTGTAGGASSGTTGQTGGIGGALSLTAGIGGAVAGASGIGGVGGGLTLAGGAGGNGAATGGVGGALSITAGAAGTGGNANGGTLTLNSGAVTGSGTSTLNLGTANATTVNLATATSATTLNIGAASTTAVTVAIAGGSGDTGCTVAGASGDLVCTGNITGSASGTVGFWARTSPTLTPATAADVVSIPLVTTGTLLTLDGSAVTQTGNLIGGAAFGGLTAQVGAARDITGFSATLPAATETGNFAHTYKGFTIPSTGAIINQGTSTFAFTGFDLASAGAVTQNTAAGTINWKGVNLTLPIITQTTGTVTADGIELTIPSSAIVTGGTMNGIDIPTITTGPAAGTLNAVNIGNITTPGSGTETALNIGNNWDDGIVIGTNNTASLSYNALTVGAISSTGTDNQVISLGTLTGGTTTNYQITTGVLTSATTTTNAQINLGGVVTTGGTTNYGINIGALSGTGTTNTALNITAATSTGTTTGIAVGALSGAGTTNTGISVGAVSGATTNNALTTAQGAVSFTDNSNTVASLSLTNNTATTFGNGANTAGVIDLQSTTLSTGNFMNIEVNALSTGTGFNLSSTGTIASGGELMSLQATGINTGRILDITSAANTLTSGQLVNISTSSTALTGSTTTGSLFQTSYTGTNGSTFAGNLNYFDYSPGSVPSTAPTGDLMRLHLGANATNYLGNIFNVVDDTSSVFSVSKTAMTTSLPANFTAAGDSSFAYDINMTNPTASFIKSAAPLSIVSGETFNSSNLTLETYNSGSIVLDTGATGTIDLNSATNFGAQITFTAADTTPDVSAGSHFLTAGTATITDFDAGASGTLRSGHIIFIECATAVTFDVTSSGLNGGTTDIICAASDTTTWVYDGTDWNLIAFMDDSDNQITGADLAEYYVSTEVLVPGDVVSINPDQDVVVNKSDGTYDGKLIGIVSTQPGLILGGPAQENAYLVALAGRVPTKVSTENGPISRGDYLTSSSVPGIAMKATQPGPTVGKALADYSGSGVGLVEVFINVSYADPANILANLTLDENGQIIASTTAKSIKLDSTLNINGSLLDSSLDNALVALVDAVNYQDSQITLLAQSLEDHNQLFNELGQRIANNEQRESSQSAQLAEAKILGEQAVQHAQTLDEKVASTSGKLTSLSDQITQLLASFGGNDESTPSAEPELTPVETMFATGSATLASLEVTSEATVSGQLLAYGATIQDTFKSLGQTFLGSTNIAGDLSVDGTFSISEGSKINALPILYFQTGPLAQAVDFFNGLVTIGKDGTVKAETILANEVSTDKLTISDKTAGQAIIPAGQTQIPIFNDLIGDNSLVILTPETATAENLSVGEKIPGSGFVVELSGSDIRDIKFNYLIIEQKTSNAD